MIDDAGVGGGLHGGRDRFRHDGDRPDRVDLFELHPLFDGLDLGGGVELGVDGDDLVAIATAPVSLDAVPQALERRDLQARREKPDAQRFGVGHAAGPGGRLGAPWRVGGVRRLRRVGGMGDVVPGRRHGRQTAEREYGNGPTAAAQ